MQVNCPLLLCLQILAT